MVKKEFCDRCGKELYSDGDSFDSMFDEVSSHLKKDTLKPELLEPQLCISCEKGYAKIIEETNRKIREYLKNK